MTRCLSFVALLAITAAGRADQPKAQPATVPFEMLQKGKLVSGHFTVQVKVNGKGPYRLIFDTGAARDLAPAHGSAKKLG